VTTWPALADAVRQCATRPAGAVHVAGRPGGLIRLRAGTVVGTWTSGTPLAVPSPDPSTRSPVAAASPLARLAMTDAVFVMAAGRIGAWRVEDDPAGDVGAVSMELDALLSEVDRRMRRVSGPDGLLPPEETLVQRVERATWQTLAPTAEESRLLGALTVRPDAARGASYDTARSVRDLAFAVGRGVFGVLLDVQRLASMGAVTLSARSPAAAAEPPMLVQARSSLDGAAVAAVSAALRRHRVGLGGDPPPPEQETQAVVAPLALSRRVPGATDRTRRRAPWQPRRPPSQADGQQ
jgi:hypothetical protein